MSSTVDTLTTQLPPLEHPLEDGWTLPASWYSDAAVAALERERIFARSWQYGGPAEHVAKPGSFMTTQAGHVPVVVTRDSEVSCAAFVNVCRHRAYVDRARTTAAARRCSARTTPGRTSSTARCGARPALGARGGASTAADFSCCPSRSTPGGRFCSSTPTRTRLRSPRRSAGCPDRRRGAASTSPPCGSTPTTSGRSRPTGRSRSRTTSSATTARSPTPASAR